ncbi:MAG: tetratricopeptide repeat protein [Chloroflexi bacterium]|nr:tetratricopeptide repeat protein [Chloroflexota bacterium]
MNNATVTTNEQYEATAVYQEKINDLNARAWAIHKSDRELARQMSREAADLSTDGPFTTSPYQRGLAESLRNLSRINWFDGNYEHSLFQAHEALTILEEQQLPQLMSEVLYTIATNYMTLGNLSQSLDFYLKQLEITEQIGDREGYGKVLLGLGMLYSEMGDHESTLAYSKQSLEVFRELGQDYWIAILFNNMCYCYFEQRDFENALAWGNEGLSFCRLHGNVRIEGVISNSIAEIYLHLDQPEKALIYLESTNSLAAEHQDTDRVIESLKLSGEVYYKRGQPRQALPFLHEALTLAEKTNYKRWMYECHQLLVEVYKKIDDFAEALVHFEQFHAIKESVQSEEVSEKLKNLEILRRTQAAQKEAELYVSLYQEEQARRTLAETMQQIGAALTDSIELGEVLDTILAQLKQIVPYDRASVLLRRGNELEFAAARGFPEGIKLVMQKVPLDPDPESQDVFLRIYHTKRPLTLTNLSDYESWHQVPNLAIPGTWLGIPLIHRDEVRGMLSLAREAVLPYDDEAIVLATTFAATAVVALENARLYNRIRRFNEQLEYEVHQRTQALQDAYEQLERLDRTKADFIAVTAHELRTPITVIKAYSQLLQKQNGQPEEDNLVTGIISGADRLHEIVNAMLMMMKIESRALEIFAEPLQMHILIADIVDGLAKDITARHLTVIIGPEVAALPSFDGDEEALKMVFENIIINAIKYTPNGGMVRIDGRDWQTPPDPDLVADAIAITVTDTGIGIAADVLELIFTKFYQTGDVALHSSGRTKFKGGGPGLGLAIARGIIEAHRGRLWAESQGYDENSLPGSQFHIVLPRTQPRPVSV